MAIITDPMHYLRKERNFKLAKTEQHGKGLPDREFTKAELDYRKALRDLPSTADPKWSSEEGLTNVTWPKEPK